ncbi:MAG: GNAT family N-acetyltransferase [Verrucomicrobia bacterium]|nr:GNAT family N-acetyltransferase [Verrucomicrobiota bacterium]
MKIADKNIKVVMVRQDMAAIPEYRLPDGYSNRFFLPGDERTWLRIQLEAESFETISRERFRKTFANGPDQLPDRQLFLLNPKGQAIGTATAWFNNNYHGESLGQVHWVALLPEYQGRGLSKPLLSSICSLLQELGHRKSYLITSTRKIAAINLYLHFGFQPYIRGPEDESVWNQLEHSLKYKIDKTEARKT